MAHTWHEDYHQRGVGGHTWESEIMPIRCQHLCRPTPSRGRTGWSRRVWQITQQPRLLSHSIVRRLLLESVILGRSANFHSPPFRDMGITTWSDLDHLLTASADVTSRPRLRSTSSQRYERPRTRLKIGERSFSCAGPRAWNGLPSSLQELTDAKTFKRKLKTFLFQQVYNWTYVVLYHSFLFLFYYATCYVIRWSILFCKRNSLWTMLKIIMSQP